MFVSWSPSSLSVLTVQAKELDKVVNPEYLVVASGYCRSTAPAARRRLGAQLRALYSLLLFVRVFGSNGWEEFGHIKITC